MELPVKYKENMIKLLKEDYPLYEKSFDSERLFGLRVNTAKISPDRLKELYKGDLRPIPWIENGFFYDGKKLRPAKDPYYYAGLYYLQEPSAMTPANRLPVSGGERILDICAAPGGKSTELGAKLCGSGLLFSNDISNSRAQALLKNLELFGIKTAVIASEAPYKLATKLPHFFDRILIDAPCSGEGMFRKDAAVMRAWNEDSNAKFSALQKQILDSAVEMLRPGGMIMYSTCTFSPMENEESISYVLDKYPYMKLSDIKPYEGFAEGFTEYGNKSEDLKKCVRIFPHKMDGEGHFVALLKSELKEEPLSFVPYVRECRQSDVEKQTCLTEFLSHTSSKFDPERIEIRKNGTVLYLPESMPDLKGIRLMRCGLLIGEIKKDRFEPSQALAMSLKKEEFDNVLSLPYGDERVLKYLKCESIDFDEPLKDGYVLVCVEDYPLGFAKKTGDRLKNKYLPGWRWQ